MARSKHRNDSPVVVDVGGGRMVAPGQDVSVDPKTCPAVAAGLLQPVKAAAPLDPEQKES